MIKGNESFGENFNSHFLTPLSFSLLHNASFWCRHFDANPLHSYEEFVNAKNNIKQRNWNTVLPISQNQYRRHPTHSSWSCNIYLQHCIGKQCSNLIKSSSHLPSGLKTMAKYGNTVVIATNVLWIKAAWNVNLLTSDPMKRLISPNVISGFCCLTAALTSLANNM